MKTLVFTITAAFLSVVNPIRAASTFSDGIVQAIEVTTMPDTVLFLSKANSVACSENPIYAGSPWLWYASQNIDTNKAIYAAVLSAYQSKSSLHLTWDTSTCELTSVRAN